MKIANPLNYPVAVLAGGITLFIGVRLVQLPSPVMLPLAAVISFAGASFFKSREPQYLELDDPQLEREINTAKTSALALANKANGLIIEARKLLNDTFQVDLLASIQLSSDRSAELPAKIDSLAKSLKNTTSLLSVDELKQQLTEVNQKLTGSSGIAKQHLNQLADSLKRNIQLAQEGQDTRLARIINITTLIQDSAGVLQKLQTQLNAADLTDSEQIQQLQLISEELVSLEENLDLLLRK
jgi:paraquat-inducible protein B